MKNIYGNNNKHKHPQFINSKKNAKECGRGMPYQM